VYTSPPTPTTVYTSPSPVYTTPSPVNVFPPSATEQAFHDGLWAGRLESAVLVGGAYYLYESHVKGILDDRDDDDDEEADDGLAIYERELTATRALMTELRAEHKHTDPLVSAIQRPRDGTYSGRSAEDDDGDQDVVTHLTFRKDGTVGGWGEDGEDGRYVLKDGVWSTTSADDDGESCMGLGGRVAWIEKYDRGHEVAVRGQIRADGTIRAMWASTVGVSGSAELVHE
jgi:hypothetical protein